MPYSDLRSLNLVTTRVLQTVYRINQEYYWRIAMSVKKFGFGSLCLMVVSAASTSLISQAGIAATSQSLSYKPLPQIVCGCPQPPAWEESIKSAYRPKIYCPDISPLVSSVKRMCPDFHRAFQGYTTDPKSSVRLAYDPDAREAARVEREAARGHSPKEVLDAAGKGINPGEMLRNAAAAVLTPGNPTIKAGAAATAAAATGITGAVQEGYNYCKTCHKDWP
ncbi:hypothetical protein IQ244_29620 [Nostoc sp. LEGE 06077]|uniref:hypothetical protein n=1 Tax=Nostoc sp. LEGE 06077 TaxID=915325 RepID=UPI00187F5AD3|nr:hypothetical protein [Nostoc sp. LEGE 06077]MBE9210588.1 hypothetical protein [Nostoc sp. LEGE 06077]